jgi:hypothetical protein
MTAVFKNELQLILRRFGPIGWTVFAAIAVLLGYAIPRYYSYQFLDAKITLIYASLSLLFALSLAVQAFAESESVNISAAQYVAGKLAAVVVFAWTTPIVFLALALLSLNLIKHAAGRLMPQTPFLASVLLLSLLLTLLVSEVAILLTLQLGSPDIAKRLLRIAMFIVVAILLFGSNWTPQLRLSALDGSFAHTAFLTAPVIALLDFLLYRAIVRSLSH